MQAEKVVFLDRDGTINVEKGYLHRPEDLILIPGAAKAIGLLNARGYKTVVVTNQAGVARGYYTEEDVRILHDYLNERLKEEGAHIDLFFYCPHHPQHGIGEYKKECACRKPACGMLAMAEQYFAVDKAHSYMIGDNAGDMGAGKNYGVKTILVGTGYGQEMKRQGSVSYDYFAEDLLEAAKLVMNDSQDKKHNTPQPDSCETGDYNGAE